MAALAELRDLRDLRDRVQPTSLAAERVLPVLGPLAPLLPAGGLACGSTVQVTGATSLVLGLVAGASQAGSWTAVVGTASVGWAAAADLGVDLARTVVVPDVALGDWGEVVAALVDAVDLVVVAPRFRIRDRDARRLAARARERGAVLIVASPRFPWPVEPDVTLAASGRWTGVGDGHGRLAARRVTVEVSGRRAAARGRRVDLWVPAVDGSVREVLGEPASVAGDPPVAAVAPVTPVAPVATFAPRRREGGQGSAEVAAS